MNRSLIRFHLKAEGSEEFYLAVERAYRNDTLQVLEGRHPGKFVFVEELPDAEPNGVPQLSPALPDFWLPQDWNKFLLHVDQLAASDTASVKSGAPTRHEVVESARHQYRKHYDAMRGPAPWHLYAVRGGVELAKDGEHAVILVGHVQLRTEDSVISSLERCLDRQTPHLWG